MSDLLDTAGRYAFSVTGLEITIYQGRTPNGPEIFWTKFQREIHM